MQSVNFEYLEAKRPDLAVLGAFAERYIYYDPSSALVKLRSFAEHVVAHIYNRLSLPKPLESNLNDMLIQDVFARVVPKVVIEKLHVLRIQGNRAAHGRSCNSTAALSVLREAHDIGRWVHLTFNGGSASDFAPFKAPDKGASFDELERDKQEMLKKVALQEANMQALLSELEATRSKAEAAEKNLKELELLTQSAGLGALDQLRFDEASTRRRLIESMLLDAGWAVGDDGKSTSEVGQEIEVRHQPTNSGLGYADYVLWDENAKPLAVIETKKTAINSEDGRTQAKCYADGLERMYGQRPVIFYSNGFETYIWDDAQNYAPRRLYGFYSKDSLQYAQFKCRERRAIHQLCPSKDIVDRLYQIETIKRAAEHFQNGHRKALIVLATGTGKTRVAIALCELLSRARWAKRILFLCDRRELRKQADKTFKEFMPGEPRVYVNAETSKDRDKRIYLATYPAMLKCYESFDVGFFDLVIADESHRSIYNRYRDLFLYFDALQVGLTATPVDFVARNTYRLFGCQDRDPTAYFSYEEAISHDPPFLTRYEVFEHTTQFLREGIGYWRNLSHEQRRQLEETEADAQNVDFDQPEMDRRLLNKDTNRLIIRNLMENGIRDGSSTHVGKSIVFARNHTHAVLLQSLFDELYPQYGGQFCRVIDNYDPRADQLIDDFKTGSLTIAISVDMLDTGVDIPEVVNLVFAKPVKSFVKFWQMIGRGTRLCPDLFGVGQHKTVFRIFDHWQNFEYFDQRYVQAEPAPKKSLMQQLFEERITLAEAAVQSQALPVFNAAIPLISADMSDLPTASIAVKEKWRELKTLQQPQLLQAFAPATTAALRSDIAPLMQWRDIRGNVAAYEFDLLITKLEIAMLTGSARATDYQAEVIEEISMLPITVNQVRQKYDIIEQAKRANFWNQFDFTQVEHLRKELRGLMKYKSIGRARALPPKIIDVVEDQALITMISRSSDLEGLDMAEYKKRVKEVLMNLFDTNETLKKIKIGEPVSEADLGALRSLVLTQNPQIDLDKLTQILGDTALDLDVAIRSIIGMDPQTVHERFIEFAQRHPELTAKQITFLSLLQRHIATYGSIDIETLYESPFTNIDSRGLDGVFTDESQVDDLLTVISTFTRLKGATA